MSQRRQSALPRWSSGSELLESREDPSETGMEQVRDRPPDCDHLFFRTDGTPNDVWRGDPALPTHKQGIIVLGTPLGCADFVEAQLAEKTEEHGILSCYCSVQHQEPVTFSELSIPNTVSSSPSAAMQGSGSAMKFWCTPRSHSQCGKWPVCHLGLVA